MILLRPVLQPDFPIQLEDVISTGLGEGLREEVTLARNRQEARCKNRKVQQRNLVNRHVPVEHHTERTEVRDDGVDVHTTNGTGTVSETKVVAVLERQLRLGRTVHEQHRLDERSHVELVLVHTVPSVPVAIAPALTFDLPNFVGELFSLVQDQTPLLSMIGGLTGGESVGTKEFVWQVEDNVAASANNVAVEGGDPTPNAIIRQEIKNVVEIHQEGVSVSYTKQAATSQLGAGGGTPTIGAAPILGTQPVQGEIPHQLALKIGQIARDVEMSFLVGQYAYPNDNVTERQTRGVLTAIETHTVANAAV